MFLFLKWQLNEILQKTKNHVKCKILFYYGGQNDAKPCINNVLKVPIHDFSTLDFPCTLFYYAPFSEMFVLTSPWLLTFRQKLKKKKSKVDSALGRFRTITLNQYTASIKHLFCI